MRQPPLILIVDDNEANRDILARRLEVNGYQFAMAADGEEGLEQARALLPDLILLDVMMPKLDGLEVCRRLKADKSLPFMPIILVTARSDSKDVVAGLDVGGDEYLTKPVDQAALVARVRSLLRIKALHDQVLEQAQRLAAQSDELAQWNRTLEQRVALAGVVQYRLHGVDQCRRITAVEQHDAGALANECLMFGKRAGHDRHARGHQVGE